ncbi:AAA family ATPase [Gordonia hongkongensis]|uniref:AAA family ATPase n=1 Tax=Gordonia hongkongensis TaxID=1701090 RepID=UPI001FFA7604|nr:AAA family ATPase [Gordonia hongkongensis]UPG66893.1 AAA family ATPase [Gordonia hongkongensis]
MRPPNSEEAPAPIEDLSKSVATKQADTGHSTDLAFAWQLDALGIPVFCLPPGGSEFDWSGDARWQHYTADGNGERLSRWRPGWSVNAVCGEMLTVFDVDTKNGAGIEQARQFLADNDIRVFGEVFTPSGGRHFYLAGHPDLRKFTPHGFDKSHVDLQANGCNVYAPGTRRPKYGGMGYVIGADGLDDALAEGDEAIEVLVGMHAANVAATTQRPPVQPWSGEPLDTRQKAYVDSAVRDEARILANTADGNRQNRLYEAAIKLGSLMAGTGLDETEIRRELTQAAERNGYLADDGPAAVQRQIDRGLDYGARNPRGVPPADDPKPLTAADTPRLATKVLSRTDLRALPNPEPLIHDTLDQGTTVLLYGKWGTGKSFIALDWAANVATGRNWQGRPVARRRVLYVAAEGAFGLKGRVDAWEHAWKRDIGADDLTVLPEPVNLTNGVQVAELCHLVEWGSFGLIVLDTLARCMVGGDENSAKDAGVVIDAMTKIRQATPGGRGVVLGVHHTGKDAKTLRGSSAFEAGVDTVYQVTTDGGAIDLIREKRKDGPAEDRHRLKIEPIMGTTSAAITCHTPMTWGSCADRVMSSFLSSFAATGASKSELRAVAEMPPASFYKGVSELVEAGRLVNVGTDKQPFYKEGRA